MKISIGVCAYNEEDNIGNLLENLAAQNVPREFDLEEIIVVSSGSMDGTNDIVSKLAERDRRIKLITEKERRGKAQALNVFFDNAKGDILVVVSADTKPTQESLARVVESMKSDVGGACAKTLPLIKSQTIMESSNRLLWELHNRVLNEEMMNGTLNHLGGDMWAIRKGIVNRIPREIINDDAYLGISLKRRGWQVVFVPNAKVFIRSPATPMEYIQQRERIVIGHKQLEEVTGAEPTTIGALAFKRPLFSVKTVVASVVTQKASDCPKIFVGLCLEMVAQMLARVNSRKTDAYLKWKQIRGTKKLD